MRCKVSIKKVSPNSLHYDYQYRLASMLYSKLATSNIELADKTHSKKGFKFYSFSNLILEDRIPEKNGLNFKKAHFFISSPDPEFIRSFAEGLLLEPEFFLGNNEDRVNFGFRCKKSQNNHVNLWIMNKDQFIELFQIID